MRFVPQKFNSLHNSVDREYIEQFSDSDFFWGEVINNQDRSGSW